MSKSVTVLVTVAVPEVVTISVKVSDSASDNNHARGSDHQCQSQ